MSIFAVFFTTINQMSFYVLLGFFFAGILHTFLPSRIFIKYLSKNNFVSIFLSSLFGIPIPLCSCGVIPTAVGLYRKGASRASVISFLISTPQIGIDSIIATYSLMGINFAFTRAFLAFIIAIFSGTLINIFDNKEENNLIEEDENVQEKISFFEKIKKVFLYGFVEMPLDIGKWLLLGLFIAGLITYFVPDNFFVLFKNYAFLNMFLILLFAIPMYVCATGSIPIVASLIAKGMTLGNAFVFLVAGPATNIASILVLLRVFGKKTVFLYIFSIILGSIVLGISIDYFLPSSLFNISNHVINHHGNSFFYYIKILSSIILFSLILYSFFNKKEKKEYLFSYKIEGMRCNKCKESVYKVFKEISKEKDIYIDLKNGMVFLNRKIDEKILKEKIELLGFLYKEK